jgi:hypothetical protein
MPIIGPISSLTLHRSPAWKGRPRRHSTYSLATAHAAVVNNLSFEDPRASETVLTRPTRFQGRSGPVFPRTPTGCITRPRGISLRNASRIQCRLHPAGTCGGDFQDSCEPYFDNVRLDNVQLSSVPEPGTWLLVAGSLAGSRFAAAPGKSRAIRRAFSHLWRRFHGLTLQVTGFTMDTVAMPLSEGLR